MGEEKILGLLGQGGLGAVLVMMIWAIGARFIKAMDALVARIDSHHKADQDHHAEVQESIAILRTRMDVIVERGDRIPTPLPFRGGMGQP